MIEIQDKYIGEFNKDIKEVARCEDGDIVKFYTRDCFNNAIKNHQDRGKEKNEIANPATGPLYINGLKENDVLAVDIIDIEIDSKGICCTMEDVGILWENCELRTKEFEIENDYIRFNDLKIKIKPMIGVIGLAPKDKIISTEDSFYLGGNMDNPLLNKGTTIYLPCEVDGGLLSIGDLHALMGDGEIAGTGIEIKGAVTVRVRIIKDFKLNWPLLETKDAYYVNANGIDSNMALTRAFKEMQRLVSITKNWDLSESAIYLSLRAIVSSNQSCMSVNIDHEESGPNFRVGVYKDEIKII